MRIIKEYIFRKSKTKVIAKQIREKRFVNYNTAQSVLIIFESDATEENHYLHSIIDLLRKDGKKVFARGYIHAKQTKTILTPALKVYNRLDFDWLERPKQAVVDDLAELSVDILIDLSTHNRVASKHLTLLANAAMKAGERIPKNDVLDFQIDLHRDGNSEILSGNDNATESHNQEKIFKKQKFIFEQLIFFLKRIDSKD